MRIEFLKMQGLGNDFLVFDAPAAADAHLDSSRLRALADRHTGVGFDQALMLEAPRDAGQPRVLSDLQFRRQRSRAMRQRRALYRGALVRARAANWAATSRWSSVGGTVRARVRDDGLVSVDMGVPNFDPRALPMEARTPRRPCTRLNVDGADVEIGAVSMGNPHAVLRVPDVKTAPVERLGPSIEHHPRFPRRTNVGFMQIVDRGHIRLRVFERGVGETLACGTGACAAVAVGQPAWAAG